MLMNKGVGRRNSYPFYTFFQLHVGFLKYEEVWSPGQPTLAAVLTRHKSSRVMEYDMLSLYKKPNLFDLFVNSICT